MSLKEGKIFPPYVIGPAQAVWAPYILLREYSMPKAHSYAAEWSFEILYARDCLSQQFFVELVDCMSFFPVDFAFLEDSEQISACCMEDARQMSLD